jgi:hypothetical protein
MPGFKAVLLVRVTSSSGVRLAESEWAMIYTVPGVLMLSTVMMALKVDGTPLMVAETLKGGVVEVPGWDLVQARRRKMDSSEKARVLVNNCFMVIRLPASNAQVL